MRLTLVDQAGAFAPSERSALIDALNRQLGEFTREWGLEQSAIDMRPGGYQIVVMHNADVANALGYHDTTPAGDPYARVFSGPVLDNGGGVLTGGSAGVSLGSVVSHEVLEMVLDPDTDRWVRNGSRMQALEASDAVQGWTVPYLGVELSDFITRAWCNPKRSGPCSRSGRLNRPFTTGKGGYQIVARAGVESQVFGAAPNFVTEVEFDDDYPDWRRAGILHPAARTARRLASAAEMS